jgi:hypothetical protein
MVLDIENESLNVTVQSASSSHPGNESSCPARGTHCLVNLSSHNAQIWSYANDFINGGYLTNKGSNPVIEVRSEYGKCRSSFPLIDECLSCL